MFGFIAVLQLAYDVYMTIEKLLVAYRECRYRSYSTRLERLEKLKVFDRNIQNAETGQYKAQFTLALEEATFRQKAGLIAVILVLNVLLAGLIYDIWFYITWMGAVTCPFLAYVMPAEMFIRVMRLKNRDYKAYGAYAMKYFGFSMVVGYTTCTMFAWHNIRFII
jgi:hypothetical protein